MGNENSSLITKEDLIELQKKQLKLEKENRKIKEQLVKSKKTHPNKPLISQKIQVKPAIPTLKPSKKVSFTMNEKDISIDPFEIFQLEPECSIDDVKFKYKKLVLKYHPDKSGFDSKEEYKVIQKAYAVILSLKEEEAKLTGQLNQTIESKENERKNLNDDIQRVNYQFEGGSGFSFDKSKFNQMFDNNKFVDEQDKGYSEWLKDDSNFSYHQPKIASKERFNEAFNEFIQRQAATKQVSQYNDPDTLISTSTNYEELGMEYIDFTNHGKYTDLKKAYTESTLHPGTVKSRDTYTSIEQLRAARSGPIVLSTEEQEYFSRKNEIDEQHELIRQNKQRTKDSAIEEHYVRLHGKAIELPSYKR